MMIIMYKLQMVIGLHLHRASYSLTQPHTHGSVRGCRHARRDRSPQIPLCLWRFQPQVRVTQSQEPPHLMSLFQGKPMIVHSGGTSRKGGQSQAAATRLFHIRQSSAHATRAVEVNCLSVNTWTYILISAPHTCHRFSTWFPQVEATASYLNTNDVFVLKSPKALFVWRGVGASDEEMAASKHVVGFLGGSATQVSEGKEPGECPEN